MSEPLEPLERGDDDAPDAGPEIAIVGLAARFPGAADAAAFWENLRAGVEAIAVLTDEELAAAGVDPAEAADPRYVRAKGVLGGADRFAAAFFGFTPREAEVMDPQHRVFLECAWEALEDAACDPGRGRGRIGVWAGAGASSYLVANLLPDALRLQSLGGLQVLLLNDRDFLATRASYALDLKGPSAAVQSACSTSLVAVHMACQSLLAGECDLALAGGVSISVPLAAGYLHEPGGVASPDGHCRAFDAEAAGAVEGNGCGIVALKRLADALADGDRIRAVVRSSAVNNDGAAKVGFTAPSVEGQAEVISESLLMAGVPAGTIGYVEAHGSGTPLGDPIEMAALTQAFRAAGAEGNGFCAVGSVKTAIGHCNTAAGAAGLIKTVLALEHRTLPPSLHFATPNPQIDFAASPFYVPTAAAPWEAPEGAPRRAGVSSFGLGGTNAHLVLEEAPAAEPGETPLRPCQLLVLSARTPAALAAAASRLAEHLAARPGLDAPDLADIAWTLQTGRKAFEHRRIVVARDGASAIAGLREAQGSISGRHQGSGAQGSGAQGSGAQGSGARPVVFLFPGLGDQYAGMARELYDAEPVFRQEVDRCAEILAPLLAADLREVMLAQPAPDSAAGPGPGAGTDLRALLRRDGRADQTEDPAAARLRRTLFAQPACFVVELALARLLVSWGIEPQATIGYSVGEYVAACLGGSLTLEQALTLVARRARWIDELPAGAMLAVPLAAADIQPLIETMGGEREGLALAATNGPHFSVVAGPAAAVDEIERRLAERGAACARLRTTHAFHSPMMEPAVAALSRLAAEVAPVMRPPRIPWISNVTGIWITDRDLADSTYWARHMRSTVRFAEGLGELLAEPERVFLEVGPGATLGTLVKQHHEATAQAVTAATLRRAEDGGSDLETLLAAVGRLWIAGAEVDWARFHGGERRRRVALPTYPFERQRYWIDPPARPPETAKPAAVAADLADWFWVPAWKRVPLVAVAPPTSERWLVFLDAPADGGGLGERIAARLRGLGHAVSTVAAGPGFADQGDGAFTVDPGRAADYAALAEHLRGADAELPGKILHLWGLSAAEPSFAAAQVAGLASLLLLAQAIAGSGSGSIRLALVANGLAEVIDGDPVHPAKATVAGALKVVRQELPRLAVGAVDVALPPVGDERAVERLVDQLLAEMAGPAEPAVALRGRQRFVRGFEPVRLTERPVAPAIGLAEGGVYLIAGAADGPGMALAEHLLRHLAARVALVLPPDLPPPASWEPWLDRVLIVRTDSADADALASALAAAAARFGEPVRGAFWTGGALAGGLLQLKTPESLDAALAPVARGAEALLAAVDALPEPPAFVVLSSTTTAVTGGVGQLEMAAAGSFLEALAARRALSAGVPTLAIHWDPYQWGGWLAAGVGGGMANLTPEELARALAAHGVSEEQSGAALARLLAGALPGAPAVVVTTRDLPALVAEVDSVTAETLLAQLAAGPAAGAERPALPTPYAAPRDELEERLAGIWQALFGIAPIGRDDSFLELGGHSLLAIQIVTQVRDRLAVDLPVTALFEAPTVAALAKSVRRARGEDDAEDLEALLALVEGLSPDEAAERLAGLAIG